MLSRRKGVTGPLRAPDETSQLFQILARANQIASNTELDDLLGQMLDLIISICGATNGTLYLLDPQTDELVFSVIIGDEEARQLLGRRISTATGIVGATVTRNAPVQVEVLSEDPRWYRPLGEHQKLSLHNVISVPLSLRGAAIGAVQVFNYTHDPVQMVELLGNRMASEIEKAMLYQASERRGQRLEALVAIIHEISSTLDRDQILNTIIDKARDLLQAEASSLFLLDRETGEPVLHISRDLHQTQLPPLRIPAGQGIIGYVVQTGETVIVNDADADERHYRLVDDVSGIHTRTILAAPLITPTVVLGRNRGTTESQIIGGLEAINKIEGTFTEQDVQLMQTLAQQAASVLHFANLYADANELFFDSIKALAAAVDAKDPYTEGHSQRVSEFSVEIARELGLAQEMVHHVRIGSLLHDVGKIGIPDAILAKPGHLTTGEFLEMKRHPTIGAGIMSNVRMLQAEIPALEQHHERLDGSGYPKGLRGEEISLFGRIVAVADIFDAITSDRPYRSARSAAEALEILRQGSGVQLDPRCVHALAQAHRQGRIRTQGERDPLRKPGQGA